MPKIIYTKTDEAPALATQSFLPIVKAYTRTAGIEVETRDISLAGRILSTFPEYLTEDQRVTDDLSELGELAKDPDANIIKLPNISASIPQLKEAIKELKYKGYALPDYPDEPENDEQKSVKAKYDRIKGSAVNPVLREGNSDRRAPKPIKNYAKKNPHSMGAWKSDSKTHVSTMSAGDFRSNEQSLTSDKERELRIELHKNSGDSIVLKESVKVLDREIIDATVMSKKALLNFLMTQVKDARDQGVLFSIHLKATMMKVSDPIIFGHVVETYFDEVFTKYADDFEEVGISSRDGLESLFEDIKKLPKGKRMCIENDIKKALQDGPDPASIDLPF